MLPCCSLLRRPSSLDCSLCHIRGSHCVDHCRASYQGSPVVPGDQSLAIRSLFIKSGKARRCPDSRSASSVEATKDDVVYVASLCCCVSPADRIQASMIDHVSPLLKQKRRTHTCAAHIWPIQVVGRPPLSRPRRSI